MRTVLLAGLASLFLALPVFANDHQDNEHQHEGFPEDALLALEGQDTISKKPCFLFIMDTGFDGPEKTPTQYFAKILTGYTHNDEQADVIEVRLHPSKPDVLVGKGSNAKDEVAIFLNTSSSSVGGEIDISHATAFNSKWWHQNHFHNNRCIDLKVHAH